MDKTLLIILSWILKRLSIFFYCLYFFMLLDFLPMTITKSAPSQITTLIYFLRYLPIDTLRFYFFICYTLHQNCLITGCILYKRVYFVDQCICLSLGIGIIGEYDRNRLGLAHTFHRHNKFIKIIVFNMYLKFLYRPKKDNEKESDRILRKLSFKIPIVIRYSVAGIVMLGLVHSIISKRWRFKVYIALSPFVCIGLCYQQIMDLRQAYSKQAL